MQVDIIEIKYFKKLVQENLVIENNEAFDKYIEIIIITFLILIIDIVIKLL